MATNKRAPAPEATAPEAETPPADENAPAPTQESAPAPVQESAPTSAPAPAPKPEVTPAPPQESAPVGDDLKPVEDLAAVFRLPTWQSAALHRMMGWEPGKRVTEAAYTAGLARLKTRRIGG